MNGMHSIAAARFGEGVYYRRRGPVGFSALVGLGDSGDVQGVIPVDGPTVTASDVLTRLRLNNGTMTISASDEYGQVVKANPSLFKFTDAGNGLITVTEAKASDYSSWLLLGGLAVGGVLLLKLLKG